MLNLFAQKRKRKTQRKEKGKAGERAEDRVFERGLDCFGFVWADLYGVEWVTKVHCVIYSFFQSHFFLEFVFLLTLSPCSCAIYRCQIAMQNTLMAHPRTLPGTLCCARNFLPGVE